VLPSTWKGTNSSGGYSEDLFLFTGFEGSPETKVSRSLNFSNLTTCPQIFSKNLCYMGVKEISQSTATVIQHLGTCAGQQTGIPWPRALLPHL